MPKTSAAVSITVNAFFFNIKFTSFLNYKTGIRYIAANNVTTPVEPGIKLNSKILWLQI